MGRQRCTGTRKRCVDQPLRASAGFLLLLFHIWLVQGIESVVLEKDSLDDAEGVIKVGVLEQGTVVS